MKLFLKVIVRTSDDRNIASATLCIDEPKKVARILNELQGSSRSFLTSEAITSLITARDTVNTFSELLGKGLIREEGE